MWPEEGQVRYCHYSRVIVRQTLHEPRIHVTIAKGGFTHGKDNALTVRFFSRYIPYTSGASTFTSSQITFLLETPGLKITHQIYHFEVERTGVVLNDELESFSDGCIRTI